MGYTPTRVVVAVLAIAGLAVATTLLPAAGLGTYPAAESPDSGGYNAPQPTSTPEPAPTPATETPRATATATPTETATETPAGGDESRNGRSLLAAVLQNGWGLFIIAIALAPIVIVAVAVVQALDESDAELPTGPLPRLQLTLRLIPQATMSVLVASGSVVANIASTLSATAGVLAGALASGLGTMATGLGGGLTGLGRAFTGVSLPSLSGITTALGGGGGADATGQHRRDDHRTSDQQSHAPPETVSEAWDRFAEAVPGQRKEAWTPGETARRAVRSEFPERPVGRLTALFRRIRYGGSEPDGTDHDAAVDAYEGAVPDDENENDDENGGGR